VCAAHHRVHHKHMHTLNIFDLRLQEVGAPLGPLAPPFAWSNAVF